MCERKTTAATKPINPYTPAAQRQLYSKTLWITPSLAPMPSDSGTTTPSRRPNAIQVAAPPFAPPNTSYTGALDMAGTGSHPPSPPMPVAEPPNTTSSTRLPKERIIYLLSCGIAELRPNPNLVRWLKCHLNPTREFEAEGPGSATWRGRGARRSKEPSPTSLVAPSGHTTFTVRGRDGLWMWNRMDSKRGSGCFETLGKDMSTSSQGNKGWPWDTNRGRDRAGAGAEPGGKGTGTSTDVTSGEFKLGSIARAQTALCRCQKRRHGQRGLGNRMRGRGCELTRAACRRGCLEGGGGKPILTYTTLRYEC